MPTASTCSGVDGVHTRTVESACSGVGGGGWGKLAGIRDWIDLWAAGCHLAETGPLVSRGVCRERRCSAVVLLLAAVVKCRHTLHMVDKYMAGTELAR